ncbi:hypothetical protein ACH4VM_38065 [Streptomyces sp. NPDC020792]|uniref:hypothetical protein n=1 Tax=Streptomyces sp. NPDC020792 TaxID=3365089 RepID=UPI0037897832
MYPETGRARLSYRRAEEIFEENTRLLANPLASPEGIEDLDGWTLHRLRHPALTHDAEGGTSTPMLLVRPGHASVRSLERSTRPGVDAVGPTRRWARSRRTSPDVTRADSDAAVVAPAPSTRVAAYAAGVSSARPNSRA